MRPMTRPTRRLRLLAAAALLLPAVVPHSLAAEPEEARAPSAAEWLDRLAEEHWRRQLEESPGLRIEEGLPVIRLPDFSYQHAAAAAEHAQGLLERLAAIDPATFDQAGDHERWLTYRILQWQARLTVDRLPFFWHAFQVTPYGGGFAGLAEVFARSPVASAEERARYLDLLGQLPRVAGELGSNLAAQRERGILLPASEIPVVEAIWAPLAAPPDRHPFRVAPERLAGVDPAAASAFSARVAERLETEVAPAFAALLAVFDPGYRAAAPAEVGLGRYPGGQEAYRFLVRVHTTLDDLAPEEVHRRGLAEVARIATEMAALRERLGASLPAAEDHEPAPGLDVQLAFRDDDPALPAFRRNAFPTAFVEGWGEYASALAAETGLDENPRDRYGRLAMDMLRSCRLVVDTGVNALGWSREQALEFLRERVLESDTQLATETLRYAVDVPAQALAKKTGALAIRDLRRRAEEALGPRFDVRRFHQAVLGHGAMPLEILAEHVEWWIAREMALPAEEPVAP
jgi:uncharacterized protein (DUF885 family)